MPNIPGSIPVSGFIAPTDATDTYPTHEDKWGKGGHRTVATLAERDAITAERRTVGMTCFVEATNTNYRLLSGTANVNWTLENYGPSTSVEVVVTAGAAIASNRVVAVVGGQLFLMNSTTGAHCGKCIGVSKTSGVPGDPITVVTSGEINVGPALVSGETHWCNGFGQLTTSSPVSGFAQAIGVAVTNSIFSVNVTTPIELY